MNHQSIDRKISRCSKKIVGAEKECQFYNDAAISHRMHIKLNNSAFDCLTEGGRYMQNASEIQTPTLVNTKRPHVNFGTWKDQLYYRTRWHSLQYDEAVKRSEFYGSKVSYHFDKIALLKMQRDYDQQPVA